MHLRVVYKDNELLNLSDPEALESSHVLHLGHFKWQKTAIFKQQNLYF